MKTIIFDFDYTLADSSTGVIKCINYALQKLEKELPDEKNIRKTIGLSLYETYRFLTGETDESTARQFSGYFIEEADRVMTSGTALFPDTAVTVRRLHESGNRIGIVSTKFRYRILEILKRENLDSYFDIIVGGEDVKAHKPDPEGINKIMTHFEISPREVLYVGDSITDARTAENAGVRFIAALTGVTPKEEFNGFKVERFIDNLSQLY